MALTEEQWDRLIPKLRAFWAEGHSTAEIGRRLGVSKNSIVGKASRLELPGRPSPIIRYDRPAPVRVPSLPVKTLPALPSEGGTPALLFAIPRTPTQRLRPSRAIRAPKETLMTQPTKSVPAKFHVPSANGCLWPMWAHNQAPTHKFCDAPISTRSYCRKHAAIAYVRVRDRDEAAA